MKCTRLQMHVNEIDCIRCGQENCDERINGQEPIKVDGLVKRKCKTENKMGQECLGCSEQDCSFRLCGQIGIRGEKGPDDYGLTDGCVISDAIQWHKDKIYINGDCVQAKDGYIYRLESDLQFTGTEEPRYCPTTELGQQQGWKKLPTYELHTGVSVAAIAPVKAEPKIPSDIKYAKGQPYDATQIYKNGDVVTGKDGLTYTLDRDPRLVDTPNNDPTTLTGLHYGWIPYPLVAMNGCKHGMFTNANPCKMCTPIEKLPSLMVADSPDGGFTVYGIRKRHNWEQLLWDKINELVERVNNLN